MLPPTYTHAQLISGARAMFDVSSFVVRAALTNAPDQLTQTQAAASISALTGDTVLPVTPDTGNTAVPYAAVYVTALRPTGVPANSLWIEVGSDGNPTGHQEIYSA